MGWTRWVPVLRGVLPVERGRVRPDLLAGATLAALAIPEVLGYARIAGMPVVTGLYTMLLPVVAFALFGFSRHLVVGADSATAAILAAGLAATAPAGSPRYVALAGTTALLVGVLLLTARLLRLGFAANFLSRTVLVGFLTGVGIQVAIGQLPAMFGLPGGGSDTVGEIAAFARQVPHTHLPTVALSLAVVVVVLVLRRLTPRIPGALLAIVAAIAVSALVDLRARGIAVLGPVPGGLPHIALGGVGLGDLPGLLPMALSMFVVILAQSAATSRAYAASYDEREDESADLVGLGAANLAAGLTGAFVVNGSPTKTEMVDGAGGRSQISQLGAAVVVLAVLLLFTGTLTALPLAALGAVVFLIGLDLVDVRGLRRIYALRRAEFVVAALTTAAVVLLGVEQGIALAVVVSIVDHLRHSYRPRSSVLVKSPAGHWQAHPVEPGARTADGLVVYRFGTSLYFANAAQFAADVATLTRAEPPDWLCLDGAAIGDVDYSAAQVLTTVARDLHARGIRLVLSGVVAPVHSELDRYRLSDLLDPDAYFDTAGEALGAFYDRRSPPPAKSPLP